MHQLQARFKLITGMGYEENEKYLWKLHKQRKREGLLNLQWTK